jgi:isoleucyl-tRNA synthetase
MQRDLIDHYQDYNFLNVYQKIHNFCVVQLGGFYLDVIKDRQYTTQTDSLARRSTQTALYHILEMFCRLIAPILSFTADEIWENIPGDRVSSVFLSNFSDGVTNFPESEEFPDNFWERIMEIKSTVNKELESKRADKLIGSGLSAEVDLFCGEELTHLLQQLGEELRFVLIVSRASIHPISSADVDSVQTDINSLKLKVIGSAYSKCERCWHHRADVGLDQAHPSLCQRCVNNIEGQGEQRNFA